MQDLALLKPTQQKQLNKNIFGFDIETYNKNKNLYCASVYSENPKFCKTFFEKEEVINFFKTKKFRGSIVAATNLGFDFMGVFYKSSEISNFNLLWRSSNLIFAYSYIKNGFNRNNQKGGSSRKITFLDTLNYASLSVEQLGKIINIPKIKKPDFLGNKPINKDQEEQLVKYNMNDAKISQKAIKFLYKSFYDLGATPKLTIGSTAMSLYKNKYLSRDIFRHDPDILIDQFKGYYGGRVEALKRGFIKDYNYYDFNSLYPSVMLNRFPDPNSLRISRSNHIKYIENYEGMSMVTVYVPKMDYPLLPLRKDNKLFFPCGEFTGYYTHIELRKALRLGYVIKKAYKSFYYLEECLPFHDFVLDLYKLRSKYKKENNPMQLTVKLLLNSLYGKFGQKFLDKDNWIPIPSDYSDFLKIKHIVEAKNGFLRIKEDQIPKAFCIPIWASYVTAYGRILLHDYIVRSNPVYYDTDSLITKKEYASNNLLGKLKLEDRIREGYIVKPKFYAYISDKNKEKVVIKGIGIRLSYADFLSFIKNPTITYKKFTKFKEALRRNFLPNEIIEITKDLTLEDQKRNWPGSFKSDVLQRSKPLKIYSELQ